MFIVLGIRLLLRVRCIEWVIEMLVFFCVFFVLVLRCGVMMMFGRLSSVCVVLFLMGGFDVKMLSLVLVILFVISVLCRVFLLIRLLCVMFMMKVVGFMVLNCWVLIMFVVLGVFGMWIVRKLDFVMSLFSERSCMLSCWVCVEVM